MRVLMLGWEFPPFISGGLGTACHGLTKALSRQNVDILFVLPRSVDSSHASHVHLITPQPPTAGRNIAQVAGQTVAPIPGTEIYTVDEMEHVVFRTIPSKVTSPYVGFQSDRVEAIDRYLRSIVSTHTAHGSAEDEAAETLRELGVSASEAAAAAATTEPAAPAPPPPVSDYGGDMFKQAHAYAAMCGRIGREEKFDVIHAHDWMTFPAGIAAARLSGKPLVVHVHSTEFDRSGEQVNREIHEIERRGMHAAMTVICVSHMTASICMHRYGVPSYKLKVVYNGIESGPPAAAHPYAKIARGDKLVLFLGRITMQKGPEYFIAAAKKVLEKISNVKFIVAGSGDMIESIMQMAEDMGIGQKVLFTGFLRGKDVERVFRLADVYVMPSVSEPFGIAPLEAIRHDVPVIISRNSGVSEVLQHVLKVDFWDIEDMANKIIAVLRHPPLSQTLREHADMEVRALTWDGAAARCVEIYQQAIGGMKHKTPVR